MSLKSHILRRTPDAVSARDTHHECRALARSLSAAYEATIERLEAEAKRQTAWIARQDQQIAILKVIAGIPADVTVAPALVGGPAMTPREHAISRQLDTVILRLERGGCSWPVRVWLRWRRRRLEAVMFGGSR